MKRKIAVLWLFSLCAILCLTLPVWAERWDWSSLPYGGGGYISGLVFHPSRPEVLYARTDVGGVYRLDKEKQLWIPLTDGFAFEDWNLYGIDGICVDPNQPDVLYIAAGKYYWNPCDVYKSVDAGKTWNKTNLNKGFYANGPCRDFGENIAVDPKDSNVIYVGTAVSGLFRSLDGAKTWQNVPDVQVSQNPEDNQQVRGILFDGDFVYVSVINRGIYRGNTRTDTWELLAGSPQEARRMSISEHTLYVAAESGVFKLENDTFRDITPSGTVIPWGAYAVDADPVNKNHVVCAVYGGNEMKYPIYRSENGGETWRCINDLVDKTGTVPWWQEVYFASNISVLKMDPLCSNRLWFGDWFGVWTTPDSTAEKTRWINPMRGLEEMVPFDGVSTAGEAGLVTAVADNDGSRFSYPGRYPSSMLGSPKLMSTTGIDVCRGNADFLARVGVRHEGDGTGGYSFDNGKTWTEFLSFPADSTGKRYKGGRIAVSPTDGGDGTPALVLLPVGGGAYRSENLGESWQRIHGLQENIVNDYWNIDHQIASGGDGTQTFYVAQNRELMISEDDGKTWRSCFLAEDKIATVKADGIGGVAILTADGVLYTAENGRAFTRVQTIGKVAEFGMGKAFLPDGHDALYAFGDVGGKMGMYCSADFGKSWSYMNTTERIPGNWVNFIEGDAKTCGTVYLGTDGRGIFTGRLVSGSRISADCSSDKNWKLENTMKVSDNQLWNSDWDSRSRGIYTSTAAAGAFHVICDIMNGGRGTGNLARLLFHYQDENNYYCLEFEGGKGCARLRKRVDGILIDLVPGVPFSAGERKIKAEVMYDGAGRLYAYATGENGERVCLFDGVFCELVPFGYVGVESEKTNAWYSNFILDNSDIVLAPKQAVQGNLFLEESFFVGENTNTAEEIQVIYGMRQDNLLQEVQCGFPSDDGTVSFARPKEKNGAEFLLAWNDMTPLCLPYFLDW